jgi:hypothetical protein
MKADVSARQVTKARVAKPLIVTALRVYGACRKTALTQMRLIIRSLSTTATALLRLLLARVKGDTMYIDPQTISGATLQGIGYIIEDKHYAKNGKLILKYEVKSSIGILDNYGFEPGTTNPSIWYH